MALNERKGQILNFLKEKLESLPSLRTGNPSQADSLMKECQQEFDRYLRLYTDKSKLKKREKQEDGVEIKDFKMRWAEYVSNETLKEVDELRPMLGLEAYEAAPRPLKVYNHSRAYDAGAMWRYRSKELLDMEIGKMVR